MRKIKTYRDVGKKRRRNGITVGIVMIALLVFSVLGYSFMGSEDEDDSGVSEFGFDFLKKDGLWVVDINGEVFGFRNLPSEVSGIDVNVSLGLGDYYGEPLYFINPGEGVSEILNNIGRSVLRYQESCFGNESCEGDLPVKSCEDNLIIFESGNETRVYQDENCIYIVGDSVNGTDAFLYDILEIM